MARVAPRPYVLETGPLRLDADLRQAWLGDDVVTLTRTEFELLWALVAASGGVRTRESLLADVWGYASPGLTRTVDQHVAQVRAKLGCPGLIATVRGRGYRIAL